MVVKLLVVSGKSAGRAIAVKRTKFLIGRAEECDIRPLSDDVSRRHCAILVGPENVWVEDLGSRNGTYVNGQRITEKTEVTDGDSLRVGVLELRFSCARQPAAAGSDDDVSRWLMPEESAGTSDTTRLASEPAHAGRGDTTAGTGVGDTTAQRPAGTDDAQAAQANPDDSATVRSTAALSIEEIKAARSTPGALPKADAKADSSKDAAAQALKKFFDNR
jgi:pSer/pThr/pTyr-binding forkhead associated (FHA) protein